MRIGAGKETWGTRMKLEEKFGRQGWKLEESLEVKDGDFDGQGGEF